MSCLYPLRAGIIRNSVDGEPLEWLIAADGHKYPKIRFWQSKEQRESFDPAPSLAWGFGVEPFLDKLDLPCGQCYNCRLEQSRQWAARITAESMYHVENWFVTLTYNPENLPHSDKGFATLRPDDVSEFIKRLRRHFKYHYDICGIRFYAAGEYGSEGYRPHYHLIIFGLPLRELGLLKPYKCNFRGDPFYNSDCLEKLWGKGFVVVGEVCFDAAAYVARYCTKKLNGDAQDERFDTFGQIQEFSRMSNRPGIGARYFDEHGHDIYEHDALTLPGVHVIRPPRYYDRLFERLTDPLSFEAVKARRIKKSALRWQNILSAYGSEDEYLNRQRITAEQIKLKLDHRE